MDLDKISRSASMDAEIGNQLDSDVGKVLRNTYMLLGASIAFSAVMAGISMLLRVPYMGLWMLLPYFALLFLIEKNKNSGAGIFWVFALTGFMGVTLGPILSAVLALRGPEPIMLALGSTAVTFFAASAYVLKTRKNLNAIGGFLFIGILIAFIGGIANVFLQMPALTLTVSCMFAVLSTGIIMWQTSEIIHGGERNYISATVTLFVMVYNLFSILLSFFGMSDD
jgi:modulator of FtsH protease